MQLPPEDGEARSRTLVSPPYRADEDRRLVDARRDKLLASGRTHTEFGQLIAKTGRSNAYRHANNVSRVPGRNKGMCVRLGVRLKWRRRRANVTACVNAAALLVLSRA